MAGVALINYPATGAACNFPGGTFADSNAICDWSFRYPVTIDHTKVAADLTNYLLYVDLSDLPSAFFTNVKVDGSDIRVTTSDGSTELAHYVGSIDDVTETGTLWVRYAGTLNSTVDTVIYIYFGNASASAYAVGDTYGRNATFQDYEAFWDFEQDPSGSAPQLTDLTGNGNDGTTAGGMTSGDKVTGKIGSAWDFDGINDYVLIPFSSVVHPLHFGGWINYNDNTVNMTWIAMGVNGGLTITESRLIYCIESRISPAKHSIVARNITFYNAFGSTINTSTNYHTVYSANTNTNKQLYLDGLIDITLTDSVTSPTFTSVIIGMLRLYLNTAPTNGKVSLAYVKLLSANPDYIATEYANQNDPSTFYTIGTIES